MGVVLLERKDLKKSVVSSLLVLQKVILIMKRTLRKGLYKFTERGLDYFFSKSQGGGCNGGFVMMVSIL